MSKKALIVSIAAMLSACASAASGHVEPAAAQAPASGGEIAVGELGLNEPTGCTGGPCIAIGEAQKLALSGPHDGFVLQIIPRTIIEDSRCPMEARCVWAGRLRVEARLQWGKETRIVILSNRETLPLLGGELRIVEIAPPASIKWPNLLAEGYRFRFAFEPAPPTAE